MAVEVETTFKYRLEYYVVVKLVLSSYRARVSELSKRNAVATPSVERGTQI